MPPKKKVKVEQNAEDGEGGEGGGKEGGDGSGGVDSGIIAVASQQAVGVGGPEAPKLDFGPDAILFEYAPGTVQLCRVSCYQRSVL